jgi:phosphatidylglycerophosphatase A
MRLHQRILITACGLGYLRPAPGTWGSLPPAFIALGLVYVMGEVDIGAARLAAIDLPLLALAAIFTLICLAWGSAAESHFGRKDASSIVADEVAGQSIALLFLPWRDFGSAGGTNWNLFLALGAFVAFRLTDIVKPPPARSFQRFQGGLGIVLDDLIAGVYALILTHLAARFIIPSLGA